MAYRKERGAETPLSRVARGFITHETGTPGTRRDRSQALRGESPTLPSVGQRVLSTSGRQLGVVAQVRPDCFHVVMDDDDVWLTREAIFTVDGQVTLICEPERICAYTVSPYARRNGFQW